MQLAHSSTKQSPVLHSFWHLLLRWRFLLFRRQRYHQLVLENIHGLPVLVLPQVCHPRFFFASEFLVEQIGTHLLPAGSAVLDMNSGCGVGAIASARWARRVAAVDGNPAAVRCTRINALLNNVEERVRVYQGDMFAPVQGQCFDVILFNPPMLHAQAHTARKPAIQPADIVAQFAAHLAAHLQPDGYALTVLSSIGAVEACLEAFHTSGVRVEVLARRDLISEVLTLYRLTPSTRQG